MWPYCETKYDWWPASIRLAAMSMGSGAPAPLRPHHFSIGRCQVVAVVRLSSHSAARLRLQHSSRQPLSTPPVVMGDLCTCMNTKLPCLLSNPLVAAAPRSAMVSHALSKACCTPLAHPSCAGCTEGCAGQARGEGSAAADALLAWPCSLQRLGQAGAAGLRCAARMAEALRLQAHCQYRCWLQAQTH